MTAVTLPLSQPPSFPTFADFPVSAADGTLAVALDTDILYVYSVHNSMWEVIGPGGGGGGSVNSVTASTPLASSGGADPNITIQTASASQAGALSAADWTTFNSKAKHVIPSTNQIVYVSSLSGNDTTGDGSYDNPWATVAHAMTQITDSGSNKPYTISILAARQVETTDVLWKPYVFIVGSMQRASYIRINGGSFKPDASMTANSWIGFSNIYVGGGTAITMNMQAIGGNNLEFVIEDCTISGPLTINGRNAGGGDFLEMYNCLVIGAITLDSVNFQMQAIEFGAAVIVTDSQSTNATGSIDFSVMDTSLTTAQTLFLNDISYAGTATIVTTKAITLDSYRGLPPTSQRTLFAGTTVTNRDQASVLPYTPTTSSNWSSVPSNVQQALDTLAAETSPSALYGVNEFTLSPTDITNKFVTLSVSPSNPTLTVLQVIGGPVQSYTSDFSVSGSTLSWSGLFLDGVLVSGDKLIVQYY